MGLQITAAHDKHGEIIAIILHQPDRDGKAQALRALRETARDFGLRIGSTETLDAARWLATDVCALVSVSEVQEHRL